MTDNPSYRGPGRPDEYYDDQYGRPQEEARPAAAEPPRAPYPSEQGHPGWGQGYEQRPPAPGYGAPGYDQGWGQGYAQRPPAPGYGARRLSPATSR